MSKLPIVGSRLSRQFSSSVSKLFGIWKGDYGSPYDRLITMRDLVDIGVASFRRNLSATLNGIMDASYKNLVVDTLHIEDNAVTIPTTANWTSTIILQQTTQVVLDVDFEAGEYNENAVETFYVIFTGAYENIDPDNASRTVVTTIYVDDVQIEPLSGEWTAMSAYDKGTVSMGFTLTGLGPGTHNIKIRQRFWGTITVNYVDQHVDALHGELLILGAKR